MTVPSVLTKATFSLELVHSMALFVAFSGKMVTKRVHLSLTFNSNSVLSNLILDTSIGETLTIHLAEIPLDAVHVIVEFPKLSALITPLEVTDTTVGLLLVHVN